MSAIFLEEAGLALREERFDDAITLLEQSLAFRPHDRSAQKLLIIATYRAGERDRSYTLAQRYLPDGFDCDVALIAAQIDQANGKREAARQAFERVAAGGCQQYEAVARSAAEQLSAADAVGTDRVYPRAEGVSGFLNFGIVYNSNIASDPDDSSSTPSGVGDAGFASIFEVNYDRRLREGWSAGGGLLGFGNFYLDEGSQFDIQFLRGQAHASYAASSWSLAVEAFHDEVVFDYERTVATNGLNGAYIRFLTPRIVTIAIGSISYDNYVNNADQDAMKYEFQSRNRYYAPFLKDHAYLGANYYTRLNETDQKSIYQYYMHKGGLEFRTPLGWQALYLDTGASLEYRRYDVPNPKTRRDLTGELGVSLGKEWTSTIQTELSWVGRRTDSTVGTFSETQNVFGLRTIISF